uniref:Uncharacterized protein n=1 Tax=Magallana gigas TaxID=29159 RepID=K1R815_MAGGI
MDHRDAIEGIYIATEKHPSEADSRVRMSRDNYRGSRMSTKSRKKVGFAEDVKSEERESRSRGRSKFRQRRSKSQDVKSNRSSSLSKKRDHSLISLVRTGSRASVRSLVKLFENVGGRLASLVEQLAGTAPNLQAPVFIDRYLYLMCSHHWEGFDV